MLLLCTILVLLNCYRCTVTPGSSNGASARKHHPLRRRSTLHDDRFLGFKFLEEPINTVARNGQIQLKCRHTVLQRNVTSKVEWKKDGVELGTLRSVGKTFISASGTLSIENVAAADEGVYQCAVHVLDGHEFKWIFHSRKAFVKLPILSRFEVQPQDREVHIGQSVGFACVLKAEPAAKIEWFHNDGRITNTTENNSITIFPLTSTLEISNVKAHHEGTYRCVASNEGKSRRSRDAELKIRPENSVGDDFSEPYFVLEPRGDVITEGGTVVLECLVNGWPQPDVRWLKNSETISVDGDRIRRLGLSSLLIRNAAVSDAGVYTCRASNSQESLDASSTVQITVAPRIAMKPRNVVAVETTDVEFACNATGSPGPSISWYKNGEAIIASEYFVIEATRLRVLGLVHNDQGVYQCMAENDAGSVQASAQLIVDDAAAFSLAASNGQPKMPSEPLGVHANVVGSRFVTLAWDPPVQRHGSVTVYHIFYKEQDSTRERMLNSSSTSLTVTPLQPDTTYVFRLAAENEAGVGKSTAQISIKTTKEKAVPGKVKNLRAIALSPETIQISWEPPSGNGPDPFQYKMFYIPKNHEVNEKETQIVMKKTSYTLHGMEKYVEYLIRVEAESSNGAGLSSETVTVRTLSDLPSAAPSDVRAEAISTTSVLVEWSPLAVEMCNGILTGYRIKYKTKLRGAKSNTLVVDGKDNSYTMTGLEPATQYMLRVAAVNQNGTGPNSDWIHVDTPLEDKDEGQVAGPPVSLKVKASSDSIQLSWLPPRSEKVMIRGYVIGWGVDIPDVEQIKVPSTLRYYTLAGLKPGREYVISLRAYNMVGNGFPIYETVRTTSMNSAIAGMGSFGQKSIGDQHDGTNETPIGVRAIALTASSVRVVWTDPQLDVPYSRQYTVRYSTSAENGGQQRYINSSETEAVIEGLRPNTQYEFAVRVNAGKASSEWSMTAVNSTLPAPPSSAPRDLTVVQPLNGDPHSLTLNWQPPKYANGQIEEYLVYYSDRSDAPDKDWILDGVKGDRLSITVSSLLPRTTYYFKIQARNTKGYGPLSSTVRYVPGAPPPRLFKNTQADSEMPATGLLSVPVYLAVIVGVIIFMLLLTVTLIWFVKSKSNKKTGETGYVRGRKQNSSSKSPPDLWINHANGQHIREPENICEGFPASFADLKHCDEAVSLVDSPHSHYHTLQDLNMNRQILANHRISSHSVDRQLCGNNKAMLSRDGNTLQRATNGRNGDAVPTYAVLPNTAALIENGDCNGTLSRSYHQSSSSLEAVQRTPQVLYSSNNRYQRTKIDFSDHGSAFSSSQALHTTTPPPQLPNQGPPMAPPCQMISDSYRTLQNAAANSNPLKSFTQLAGAPPPISPLQSERTAHLVRPVVIASPSMRNGKPAGVVIGQKSSKVPIGRATAQPRVNVASIYSSYASCPLSQKVPFQHENGGIIESQPLQLSNSTEELNAQMENLDIMIDDLQALQHEFSATS